MDVDGLDARHGKPCRRFASREPDIHQSCHGKIWRDDSMVGALNEWLARTMNRVAMKLEHDTADVRYGAIAVPKIAVEVARSDEFCHVRRKASLTRNDPGV